MSQQGTPPPPQGTLQALAESSTVLVISRLAQMLGIPAGLFLLAWMFNTIQDTKVAISTLSAQVAERTKDPYTATDARHDFAVEEVRFQALDRRVGVLESAMSLGPGTPVPSFRVKQRGEP